MAGGIRARVVWVVAGILAACAAATAQPLAYLLDHVDKWTESAHAQRLLREAGFTVEALPLDRSPLELADGDLILIGSFASEDDRYRAYMARFGNDLAGFAALGRVVVQLAQADQTEEVPVFVPEPLEARRCDDDSGTAVVVAPDHPLAAGVAGPTLAFHRTRTVWEAFREQSGFEVIIAADELGERAALMEGAWGKGRIILAAMTPDKTIEPAAGRTSEGDAAFEVFRRTFFRNLASHAAAVRAGRARTPVPTVPAPSPRAFAAGGWTLAVLPDTQLYSLRHPGLFTAQTGWIVANRERRAIRYVIHLGDIVHNNTPAEWRHARDAMALLDGVVPWAVVPGNHDYGPNGDASTRETLLNETFPYDVCAAQQTFGGAMEAGKLDNTFHLFEAGAREWIILCLEWAPRDETVAWANEVMERHAGRVGILVTHAYMNNNDRRYDHADTVHPQQYNPHHYRTPGTKNDGEQLWQKLVRRHNFALTLNGHVLGDGTGYLASRNDLGFTVHQMLANFQMRALGGEAYLRLLEFDPDGTTVRVKSYSPLYDAFLSEPDQQFSFTLDQPAGVSSGR